MASHGPDPHSLRSWQDAFQYPIPTVRRVEQELRRDIASNKEKLRALVGTRYRDLVGTAETIVSMNREMQDVDTTLADIARRCNPRLMEKKHTHFNQIHGEVYERDVAKRSLGGQLALLHRCTASISGLLRRRSSPLLVSKLLVVCRLLHNKLSQQPTVPPFLDNLRSQLASLRQTLLKRTGKRLASVSSTADDIIEALAAYCLAKSSSSDDAIRNFHKVRLDAIGSQLEQADVSGENVLTALRLYIHTLQTSKILLSRRFSDVLSKLKARPILTDLEIRNIDDLGLDVLGRWVAPEVSNFTPWIKLSEVSKQEAEKTIKQWSKEAFGKLMPGCEKTLATWSGFSDLLALREKTLELWLSSWNSTPTHSSLQVLDGIRTVFNKKLMVILSDRAKALEEFGQNVASVVSKWDDGRHPDSQSLWDQELLTLDYSNGAAGFKEAVVDRLLGRDDDILTAMKTYQSWLNSIENAKASADELHRVRWTDVFDEGEDDDVDIDIPALLNEDDPRTLMDALQSAVRAAFEALHSSFNDTFKKFGTSHQSEKAAFMLKLIRLVRKSLPTEFIPSNFAFSEDIVPQLQEMLASEVITRAGMLKMLPKDRFQKVPGRSLWEGDPEVPVQPSPSAFKFLRRLIGYMDRHGPGLWDESTAQVLKVRLQRDLSSSIASAIESLDAPVDSGKTPSDTPSPDGDTTRKDDDQQPTDDGAAEEQKQNIGDRKLQLFFDAVYLRNALAAGDSKDSPLSGAIEKLRRSLETGQKCGTIMDQGALEYWKRTRLLFGLLAVGEE